MITVRGDKIYFEGNEYVEETIVVQGPLKAGRHNLGKIRLARVGNVPVSVSVGRNGRIKKVDIAWPKRLKPELLHRKSHLVHARKADGSPVPRKQTPEEHCELHRLPIIVGDKIVGW